AYATLAGPDPVSTVAAMMGAYHRCHPLSPDEIAIAADLVIGRLVQSYTIGLWRSRLHPDNRDYILIHSQPVRTALDALAGDLRTLRTRIEDACT
ncbi:aminoglycoside phosphotransferase, partial [bacterium]|nr:aminoglycoside phosphotransferase [bacterium]